MTIKELCLKCKKCDECPFENACDSLNCTTPNNLDDRFIEVDVTRSIIETAKILKGEQ